MLLSLCFRTYLYHFADVGKMVIDTDLLKMLSAIVVAIFLAVPYWKAKYFTRVAVKKGGSSNA